MTNFDNEVLEDNSFICYLIFEFLNKKSNSNIKTEKDADGKDVNTIDTSEAKNFTYVNVDMMKVVREVEKLTGTKLVYTVQFSTLYT